MSLKRPSCFGKLRDVRSELLKRRDLPAADFIPVALVNSEQLDEEHHGIVLSQPMCVTPVGDGLVELVVEIGLIVVRHGDHFADTSNPATDSISV